MDYKMVQRIITLLLILLLLGTGSYMLVSSGEQAARAAPSLRPLFDAPWSANVKVNDDSDTAEQWLPAIAVDSSGNAYAVWQDERNGHFDIYFSYRPADGIWEENVKVNDYTGLLHQVDPAIAVDSSGNAYAVWTDLRNNNDFDIYFSYRPADGSWGENVKVNQAGGMQAFPDIAVDPSGNAYAVWWDEHNNGDVYFSYRPADGSWGAEDRVNDDPGAATQGPPAIAVDSSGNAYAVWHDRRNIGWDIYFSYRPAGESWGENVQVNDDTSWERDSPDIAVDSSGNAYAVWRDKRDGSYWDIYFSYRPAGESWGTNMRVNDGPDWAVQHSPAIAVDASGNAYTIWQDYRGGDTDIYFSYGAVGEIAPSYGVTVTPATDGKSGNHGETVAYALQVTNTGNITDTFNVAVSGNSWTTTAPGTVGPLAAGADVDMDVMVTIPESAAGGETDVATVTVTSQGDDTQWATSTLTTTANLYRVFLPIIMKNY